MVDLQTSPPNPSLRPFIRLYVQRRLVAGANLNEPVPARLGGLFEFHFASLYRVPIVGTGLYKQCAPMLVVGPMTRRRVQLQADGAVEAVTVMFQPQGLHDLFGIPTHLITEHAEEAHSLLGKKIANLYQRLGDAPAFQHRVDLLNRFFLDQAPPTRQADTTNWSRSLTWYANSRRTFTVRQIAAELNTSVRRLERKSLDYTGMSPQSMLRVARFARALRLKARGGTAHPPTWLEVAHAAGYYDQMHMIREFRTLGGAVPTTLTDQLEPHHGMSLLIGSELPLPR